MKTTRLLPILLFAAILSAPWANPKEKPFLEGELIFPLEHWHNHASCIVEQPNGDLLVCWFHGTGERESDDVLILGSRKKKGQANWSQPFVMDDVPGFPDANPSMFVDPHQRLWLIWPTIQDNKWDSALLKYRISNDYQKEGVPNWEVSRVLHLKPGDKFLETVEKSTVALEKSVDLTQTTIPDWTVSTGPEKVDSYINRVREHASNKLYRRIGWMTRAHPFVLEGKRVIIPLYSDAFSFSLMAISDDWGKTWTTSTPIVGVGNIQPSMALKKDGTIVAYMRDAGILPKRLQLSKSYDRGETWTAPVDTDIPNPGAGAEVLTLKNGNWVLIYNDLEERRYSLAVALSDDEGKTWKWKRHLERDESEERQDLGSYHYPSILEASDGTFHVSYSYSRPRSQVEYDAEGKPKVKSIKHAHFNLAWIEEGGP